MHYRIAGANLVDDKNGDSGHRDDAQRGDPVRRQPILFLPLIEHDLQRAHADGQQAHTPVIDAATLPPDVGRIENEQAGHDDGGQPHRQVDVEDPAPTEIVGEVPANHGTKHGRHHDAQAPEGHGFAAVLRREGFQHHGLREWLERASSGALDDAEEDQHGQRLRHPTQKRRRREPEDGRLEHALAPEIIRQPAGHGKDDGVGHQVRRQHPGRLFDAG